MRNQNYDKKTGKPLDLSYLEKNLPTELQEDIEAYTLLAPDDETAWEAYIYNFSSDIAAAYAEGMISQDAVTYLREKYMRR